MILQMWMAPLAQWAAGQSTPPAPAPAPKKKQSLVDRIMGRLFPQQPGLLSQEDQSQLNQQGLLQLGTNLLALSGPHPQGTTSMGQLLGTALGATAPQVAEQAGLLGERRRAEELGAQRRAIIERHSGGMSADETPQQMGARLMRMLPEFVRLGDQEMVGKLTELLKSMDLGGPQSAMRGIVIPPGGVLVNPVTGDPLARGNPQQRATPAAQMRVVQTPDGPRYATYDGETGEWKVQPHGPPQSGGNARRTESQSKMAAHLQMIPEAVDILDSYGKPDRWQSIMQKYNIGEGTSEQQQLVDAAARQIADAFLRMTTGAAYNSEELANALIINTPRPGDKPSTLEYKKRQRARLVKALETLSGDTFEPSPTPGIPARSVTSPYGTPDPNYVPPSWYREGMDFDEILENIQREAADSAARARGR